MSHEVVVSVEASGLVPRRRGGMSVDEALARGVIVRSKVEGLWLYSRTEEVLRAAEDMVFDFAHAVLEGWFLGPIHPLTGYIGKWSDSPRVSKRAAVPLIRRHLRRDRLRAVGVLSATNHAYAVIHLPSDTSVLMSEIEGVKRTLAAFGFIETSQLSGPDRELKSQAWRTSLLAHCEYLGIGWLDGARLNAWKWQ